MIWAEYISRKKRKGSRKVRKRLGEHKSLRSSRLPLQSLRETVTDSFSIL